MGDTLFSTGNPNKTDFCGLSQNEVPTVSPWLVSRAVLLWPDLMGLASYLAAAFPSPGSPTRRGEGRLVHLAQGA